MQCSGIFTFKCFSSPDHSVRLLNFLTCHQCLSLDRIFRTEIRTGRRLWQCRSKKRQLIKNYLSSILNHLLRLMDASKVKLLFDQNVPGTKSLLWMFPQIWRSVKIRQIGGLKIRWAKRSEYFFYASAKKPALSLNQTNRNIHSVDLLTQ